MVLQQPGETRDSYIKRLDVQLDAYEAKPQRGYSGRHYGIECTRIRRELIRLHKEKLAEVQS